jgi:hypothetical protein
MNSELTDVYAILSELKREVDTSKGLFGQAIVKREKLERLINNAISILPDDFNRARTIKKEREEILKKASEAADKIVKDATNTKITMINENEITQKAYKLKDEILASANQEAKEISQTAKKYSMDMLDLVEARIHNIEENLNNSTMEMNQIFTEMAKQLKKGKSELK